MPAKRWGGVIICIIIAFLSYKMGQSSLTKPPTEKGAAKAKITEPHGQQVTKFESIKNEVFTATKYRSDGKVDARDEFKFYLNECFFQISSYLTTYGGWSIKTKTSVQLDSKLLDPNPDWYIRKYAKYDWITTALPLFCRENGEQYARCVNVQKVTIEKNGQQEHESYWRWAIPNLSESFIRRRDFEPFGFDEIYRRLERNLKICQKSQ